VELLKTNEISSSVAGGEAQSFDSNLWGDPWSDGRYDP